MQSEPLNGVIHLAAPGFEAELASELGDRATRVVSDGPLFFESVSARGEGQGAGWRAWAQNTWLAPVRVRFTSIADAATALMSLGRRWALAPTALPRRAALIESNLPKVKVDPIAFPEAPPSEPLGSWALVAQDELVASPRCTSPFPNGEIRFVEDHVRPPSRAYLKLWEAFTVAGARARPGDRCVDLGSSPGGWTWALERLGARVISVDKAPIAESLTRLTRVRYVKDSAFAIDPTKVGRVDWLVSDVICYPERSVRLIQRWIAAHPEAGFVVTIKLQGHTDTSALRELDAVRDARLVHLVHNKHELTWIRSRKTDE